MKILGLDYGTKNVGVALSDDGASMAFPKGVFKNDDNLIKNIKELIEKEGVEKIVVGDPGEYEIQEKIKNFASSLETKTGVSVKMEREDLTSLHSALLTKEKPKARMEKSEEKKHMDEKKEGVKKEDRKTNKKVDDKGV